MDSDVHSLIMIGDFPALDKVKTELDTCAIAVQKFSDQQEFERIYILAAIRRTLSLISTFRHSVVIGNEQMATTLLRLNLDTLARFYALFWADDTDGMTAETFARQVFYGKKIGQMQLRNQKSKAIDTWLISQIESLAPWIRDVYNNSSGAIHFSNFHMRRILQQAGSTHTKTPTGLLISLEISPKEQIMDPNQYSILVQAFLHICLLLLCAIQDRCEIRERP